MATKNKEGYLAQYGEALAENGYFVLPIEIGRKKPVFKQWSHLEATPAAVLDWIASGMASHGVGIITRHTPGIDIDVTTEEIADKIEAFCLEHFGPAPVRYGNGTKRLLLYRTDVPFPKQKSAVFRDEWGDKQHVEVLADGQQFVAYHTHPDTGRPYRWENDQGPNEIPAKKLTGIALEQTPELLDFAEELFVSEGWTQVQKRQAGVGANPDDPFADAESVININEDELRRLLMLVPGADDYHQWTQIGMALYHQFDGQDTGFDMWDEWSSTADNYKKDDLRPHWKSFEIAGKGKAPVTARTIVKLAREAEEQISLVELATLRGKFRVATNELEWKRACADVRKSQIDSISRSELLMLAKDTYSRVTQGGKIAIQPLRQALAYDNTREGTPQWCREWVYDTSDDKFVSRETKTVLSLQGFNAANSRLALSRKEIQDGKTQPSSPASDLALNVHHIPIVNGRMFAPNEDVVFTEDGKTWVNTYRADLCPEIPNKYSKRDLRNIQLVDQHIAHLLTDERERDYLRYWLAWVVQNPGELMRWAILLQGTQGDGKSFFMHLLRAALGPTNVRPVNAKTLEHPFTDWAHGQMVVFVEEARMLGHGGADVLNTVKPNITNTPIEIHPKGRAQYWVRNTSNYFITSNFKNAMPIQRDERRYCVLFSQWQNRDDLLEFKLWNPTYYPELYRSIEQSPGALRKWLLRMEIPEWFPAGGDAPITNAMLVMANAATPQFIRDMRQMIKDKVSPFITEELVSVTAVIEQITLSGGDVPEPKTMGKAMEMNGYSALTRYVIDGERHRFWTTRAEAFPTLSEVRKHIARNTPEDDGEL